MNIHNKLFSGVQRQHMRGTDSKENTDNRNRERAGTHVSIGGEVGLGVVQAVEGAVRQQAAPALPHRLRRVVHLRTPVSMSMSRS